MWCYKKWEFGVAKALIIYGTWEFPLPLCINTQGNGFVSVEVPLKQFGLGLLGASAPAGFYRPGEILLELCAVGRRGDSDISWTRKPHGQRAGREV